MADDAALRGAIASRGRRGTHRFFLSPSSRPPRSWGSGVGQRLGKLQTVPCLHRARAILEADRRSGRRTCFPLAASL